MKTLAIVVPCYNEEEALPKTVAVLSELLAQLVGRQLIRPDSAMYFIDDGSTDSTWSLIEQYAKASPHVRGMKLSGNRGHQYALMAGMTEIACDVMVTMDADLQDDTGVVEAMLQKHEAGAEIVYGVRNARDKDSFTKRFCAELYYKFLHRLGVRVIYNHADFRLLGRKALDALRDYREANLFVRGIIPRLGFTTATVDYARAARVAGTTKYTPLKMTALAWDGVTSFSALPLRLIFLFGLTVALVSFLLIIYALWSTFVSHDAVAGWTSTVVPIFFLGGVQLVALGVIGEYVGKIYIESKARPRYHIEKRL